MTITHDAPAVMFSGTIRNCVTIYMTQHEADPGHVIGYHRNGRFMANTWRCAIVRWLIRRLLP